jgi:hypothetical protein
MDGANHRRPILTYQIASGQTYYAAVNERTVYLKGDPAAGFSLCGPNVEHVVAPTGNGR